jgi:GntR family transcriptional regulator
MKQDYIVERLLSRLASDSGTPAAHLIVEDIWLAVVEGAVGTGARLPTARQLAVALGVSPRTVERSYEELERRGVISTRAGEGSFVSLAQPAEAEQARYGRFRELCRDTVEKARDLGFGIEDLIAELGEYRHAVR